MAAYVVLCCKQTESLLHSMLGKWNGTGRDVEES